MDYDEVLKELQKTGNFEFNQGRGIFRLTRYISHNNNVSSRRVENIPVERLIEKQGLCFGIANLFNLYKLSKDKSTTAELHERIKELLGLLIGIMHSNDKDVITKDLAKSDDPKVQEANLQVLIHLISTIQMGHPSLEKSKMIAQKDYLIEFQEILGFNKHEIQQYPTIFIHRNSKEDVRNIVNRTGSVILGVHVDLSKTKIFQTPEPCN